VPARLGLARGEHELRDHDGKLLARLESNAGRHRLTHPRIAPILSWPDLNEGRHQAEALALRNLPPDPQLAARIKRESSTPHPMGPPPNRQLSRETAIASDWRPTGNASDMPDIPDFLRRAKP
jgi:hypothetical protein